MAFPAAAGRAVRLIFCFLKKKIKGPIPNASGSKELFFNPLILSGNKCQDKNTASGFNR